MMSLGAKSKEIYDWDGIGTVSYRTDTNKTKDVWYKGWYFRVQSVRMGVDNSGTHPQTTIECLTVSPFHKTLCWAIVAVGHQQHALLLPRRSQMELERVYLALADPEATSQDAASRRFASHTSEMSDLQVELEDFQVNRKFENIRDKACAICMEDFHQNDVRGQAMVLECKHAYHTQCLPAMMRASKYDCP